MGTTHIGAQVGEIAPTVLLPGDPRRARQIADKFLTDVQQVTVVRDMSGYTGRAGGRDLTVMGSGMGMPSLGIYAHELMESFGIKRLIRVGTCGSMQPDIQLKDVVLAQASSSTSNLNFRRFGFGMSFAPVPDFGLLLSAFQSAQRLGIPVHVGGILAEDMFYVEYDPEEWRKWAPYGVLAVEMESAELFTKAAWFGRKAMTILTVSDNLATGKKLPPEERETAIDNIMKIVLGMEGL